MKVERKPMMIEISDEKESNLLNNYRLLTDYRDAAKRTAGNCTDEYLLLGMVGESGEVVDVLKKIVRDVNNGLPVEKAITNRKEKLMDELGDVLWYCFVYHDEVIDNNIVFAGIKEFNLGDAIHSALDLVMCCAEWAMLGSPIKTESTFQTALYAVYDVCCNTGIDIAEVMQKNVNKLSERYAEGFKLGVK